MVSKMIFPRLVFASIFIACCLTDFSLGQTVPTSEDFTSGVTLPDVEMKALENITKILGKTDWNSSDPCISNPSWDVEDSPKDADNVICNFTSNNNTTHHVTHIFFKRQNLSGTLPSELVNLPHLITIDLTGNYLNGTIPKEWGSTQLTRIDLLGNRLTGPIPEELGKLSNLTHIVVEHNNLSGTLPSSLGDLPIEIMCLNSNNFTGELPESFARLTKMKIFRIGDNSFTGNIPNFIFQNWINLEEILIVGSGLSGPIPNVNGLANLKNMFISDLNGAEATFPELSNLNKFEALILRNCNLIGELPVSLKELPLLQRLDVSFNKLSGSIPDALSALLDSIKHYSFLTGNMFNGTIPDRIRSTTKVIDVSYNNFTTTVESSCMISDNKVNLFASSSRPNNSGIVSCLKQSTTNCPAEPLHNLSINCGGSRLPDVNGITYLEDNAADADAGPSVFSSNAGEFWAMSSTGHFWEGIDGNQLTVKNTTSMNANASELYTTARRSASSLTYYVFCLKNKTYKVDLHFAELQFVDGNTYKSLGRRIFNVYIQGKLKLENFNIMDKAGGTHKPHTESFNENVTDGTLEIHLLWAGKGTTAIPEIGIYGPLISGISIVDSDYKPQVNRGGISTATVVGIVAGALAFAFFLILGILWWNGYLKRQPTLEQELKGIELNTNSFSLRQIKAATNNFDDANKIGEGGFGPVYKGTLVDGTMIAVKQLSALSKQGNREFVTEIGMISALQHPHLVKLYGCCIEGNQLLLIYEYLENNSLARALFGSKEFQLKLDWTTRRKICIGIAKGLAYLHEESRLKIVHRDIKANNVLLDKNLNPKISDFGLAKLNEEDDTHISTRIAGTYGYMAPEYAMHGHLTDKADVYSFGIVALEIVSGKSNRKNHSKKEDPVHLLEWVHILKVHGSLLDLVDPRIGSDCNTDQVMAMINVALLCTNLVPAARPSMSTVVSVLEGRTNVQDIIIEHSSFRSTTSNVEAMKKLYQQLDDNEGENSQTKSMLANGPWTSSSTSAADLYPINLSSGYLHNRDSIV